MSASLCGNQASFLTVDTEFNIHHSHMAAVACGNMVHFHSADLISNHDARLLHAWLLCGKDVLLMSNCGISICGRNV